MESNRIALWELNERLNTDRIDELPAMNDRLRPPATATTNTSVPGFGIPPFAQPHSRFGHGEEFTRRRRAETLWHAP